MIPPDALNQLPFLEGLSATEREALASVVEQHRYSRGEYLFERGSRRGITYILMEGEIELQALVGERPTPMIVFEPFDLISTSSLFDNQGTHYQSALVRSTEVRVFTLTTEAYQRLRQIAPVLEPRIMAYCMNVLDRRLDHANRKLLGLMAVGHASASAKSAQEMASVVLPILSDTLRAEHLLLLVNRGVQHGWQVVGAAGYRTPWWEPNGVVPHDTCLEKVSHNLITQWLIGEEAQQCAHYETKEMMFVPCLHEGVLTAVLAVGDRHEGHFTINTELHLESVSSILAAGIHRLSEHEEYIAKEELGRQYIDPYDGTTI